MIVRLIVRRITPIGAAAIALGLALATIAAWYGLDRLARSRAELAFFESQVEAGKRPASPLLADGLLFAAKDHGAAQAAMLTAIRSAATERRLLVEQVAAVPVQGPSAELAANIVISGPEADVLQAVRRVEAGRPAIRFAFWRLARTGPSETAIRIEARALGWWELRR